MVEYPLLGNTPLFLSAFIFTVQVLKIAILAEKYATDYSWYVDTILELIRVGGDFVGEEVNLFINNMIKLLNFFDIPIKNNNLLYFATLTPLPFYCVVEELLYCCVGSFLGPICSGYLH